VKQKKLSVFLVALLVMSALGMARGMKTAAFFTIGQDVNDMPQRVSMPISLGFELGVTDHLFGEIVYTLTPDYIRSNTRLYTYGVSLFAGYRFRLSKKINFFAKAGVHRSALHFQNLGADDWYNSGGSQRSTGIAAGGGFDVAVSDKIDFRIAYDFKDKTESQSISFGLKLKFN